MKRAIVTGASGFVGFQLVRELLENRYEVLAVVHTPQGMQKIKSLNSTQVFPLICNIPDFENLYKAANGAYDVFFHMAWTGVSGQKSRDGAVQLKNVTGAIKAVETAKKLCCKRFLGAGSIHEIECMKEMEHSDLVINYANYYKTAKLTAHYYCKLEAAQSGIDFLWPRLTNTYGVGERSGRLISSVVQQLLKGESPSLTEATQLYNFIYISDTATAYRMIAERGNAFQNYILGSEEVRPLKEYLIKIRDIVNPTVKLGFGKHAYQGVHLERQELYSEALFKDIGFHTEVAFHEGIKRTEDFLTDNAMATDV